MWVVCELMLLMCCVISPCPQMAWRVPSCFYSECSCSWSSPSRSPSGRWTRVWGWPCSSYTSSSSWSPSSLNTTSSIAPSERCSHHLTSCIYAVEEDITIFKFPNPKHFLKHKKKQNRKCFHVFPGSSFHLRCISALLPPPHNPFPHQRCHLPWFTPHKAFHFPLTPLLQNTTKCSVFCCCCWYC